MSEAIADTRKPAVDKLQKSHPDAELFRMCEEAALLGSKENALFEEGGKYYIADDDERDNQLEPIRADLSKIVQSINRIHAHTLEGIQKRANLVLKLCPDMSDFAEETYYNIAIPAAITRDLLSIDLSRQTKVAPQRTPDLTPEQLEALMDFAREVYCAAEGCMKMALQVMPTILTSLPTWDHAGARETVQNMKIFTNEIESLISLRIDLAKTGVKLWPVGV